MSAALRSLGLALVLSLAIPAQAQIAYRAGSSVSAVSTDVWPAGSGGFAAAESGNLTPGLPANWEPNDLWLAVIESRDNVPATMPAGWTLLNEASGASGLHRATLFWKRAVAGDTAPLITHPGGGRITAKIMGFRRVDLDQPFDGVGSFTGSPEDLTTEAASITTEAKSLLVFTAHIGAYSYPGGTLAGSSPWTLGAMSKWGEAGDGVTLEVHYSNMREAGAQAALTLNRTSGAGESHGALIALRPDKRLTVARPAAAQPGDLMVASLMSSFGAGTQQPPAGWTLARRLERPGQTVLEVYLRAVTGAEPPGYTWTLDAKGGAVLGMQVFSGVDTADPVHLEGGADTSGVTHATPSLAVTLANTMLVSTHGYAASDAWSPPAGMTETLDVATYAGPVAWGVSLAMSYAAQPAAGATGAKSATVTLADIGHAHLLALRPAAQEKKLYFVHADHLSTPREIYDDQQRLVWRWSQAEPFGDSPPDENPSGLGAFQFDLGFPGQVRNRETGTFYNYYRDCYDPATGRYCQFDPVGLKGGPNGYVYAYDPLTQIDPEGLMGYRGGKSTSDFSSCSYYDSVAANVGCKYHGWAGGACRGEVFGVEAMSTLCMITTAQMNCIRRCLVEEDQNARGRNECKVCTDRGSCTRLSCINDYHKKCFAKCNVSTYCYGGRYWQGFPNDGDSPGQGQCCGK
jgi:RHS repeat-associated protein